MGGEIDCNRKALLPRREVASVKRVGIFRRGEAGILPDSPGLVDIHRGVGAAHIRRDARPGLEEIDAFEVGFAIAGFYRNALGCEPRLGAARRLSAGGVLKCDIRKIRYAAHFSNLIRHGRTCSGHPRLVFSTREKTWMPGGADKYT